MTGSLQNDAARCVNTYCDGALVSIPAYNFFDSMALIQAIEAGLASDLSKFRAFQKKSNLRYSG